jgi:predicted transcriptional regulator
MALRSSIDHPIFEMISNSTRRKLLQLIACDRHYGNHLAKIVDVSIPTAHRQLAFLSNDGDREDRIRLIEKGKPTKESISGHRGAEAQPYYISTKLLTLFAIFPNLIYSKVLDDKDQDSNFYDTAPYDEKLETLEPELIAIFNQIKEKNKIIGSIQNDLYKELSEKSDLLGKYHERMKEIYQLDYEESKLLHALACMGANCVTDFPLELDEDELNKVLDDITNKAEST